MSDGDYTDYKVGTVKWFQKDKGFGFIKMPNGGLDVFIHSNQLRKSGLDYALQEGDKVRFVVSQGPKGSFATDISKIEGDASP